MRIQPTPTRRCAVLAACVILAACGASDSTGGEDLSGNVSLTAPTSQFFLVQSGTVKVTIGLTRMSYTAPLAVTASGVPSGVTATFTPDTLSGAVLSTTLTLTAATDAPASQAVIFVKVTGPDGTGAGVPVMLSVFRPQVNVTRNGTGSGTVTSNPAGVNCGGACSASFQSGTSVTLTAAPSSGSAFAGWSGDVCSGASSTCTFTVTTGAAVGATFNSTAQSFSFSIDRTTASVPQGASSTATVNITRVNGYAGAITLAVTGAPSGVTIAANPTSITGNTATLNISSANTVAAGNYPIAISATGAGITGAQVTPLNVQVTPAQGGTGDVAISFAACDAAGVPIWFAVQNGAGPWTRVTPSNNTFSFSAGVTNGVAWVTSDGVGFSTSVLYGGRADVTTIALGSQCAGLVGSSGTKHLTGNVIGADPRSTVSIVLGGATAQVQPPQGGNFTMDGVPGGPRDLVSVVAIPQANGGVAFPRLIFRRGVNYNGTIPTLDFNSTEFISPLVKAIATTNGLPDQVTLTASFMGANGPTGEYMQVSPGPQGGLGYVGVPDSLLQPGDLHAVTITALSASGSAVRVAYLAHHSVVADAVTFGPALSQPAITTLGTSPYLRLRAQLASQPDYPVASNAEFDQGANTVSVTTTAAYLGAPPSNWRLDVPDLSSASYNAAWGLKSGSSLDWQVVAAAGNVLTLLGASPSDGDRIMLAGAVKSSVVFSRSSAFSLWKR